MNTKSSKLHNSTHDRQLGLHQGFIRKAEVIGSPEQPGIIPVSVTTWDDGVRSGRYPPGIRLSKRSVAWPRQVISELCEFLSQGKNWSDRDNQAVDL